MESAQERKARLKAMREEAAAAEPSGAPDQDMAQPQAASEAPSAAEAAPQSEKKSKRPRGQKDNSIKPGEPVLKFRNYNVRDSERIQHTVLEPARPPEFKEPTVQANTSTRPQDLIANLSKKKPNQDLRRDVEKALAKLERRTQRALIEIAQSQAIESES